MALFISDRKVLVKDFTLHIPLDLKKCYLTAVWSDNIIVWADGDELDFIRTRFDNLPITKGNICRWHGAMAAFIINNL